MPAASTASLSFLPWVRQGAARAITTDDSLGAAQAAVADVSITLDVNGSALLPPVSVRLRGPADVVGIDTHQIVRTDPRPGASDFEPNCFPSIEFDRPDFPWLFTPARANANTQLRPWLCLVVVRKQDGVQIASTVDAPLPILTIAAPAKPFVELPDLKDCWAWAHSQVAADNSSNPNGVSRALDGASELSLSRLVCARLLEPSTNYLACVVPTFDLGRKAGLGLPIADSDLTAANALLKAWTLTPASAQVQLPVYHSWEFRTAPAGDFQSLATGLTIASPKGLGQRTVDIAHPGFPLPDGFPSTASVKVEGALRPLHGPASPVLWTGQVAAQFEQSLASVVNQPGLNAITSPAADPLLAPPLYGHWHAGRAVVTPGAANWLDELNLDPRWRYAAAIGTRVVQQHQEALMASAWEQAAAIQPVNQRLRQLQLSMAAGERMHARHLVPLSEEMTLRFASPAFSRIRVPSTDPLRATLAGQMLSSSLPMPATRVAMRRLGRQRGPLTRRVVSQGVARSTVNTWVARLNNNDSPNPAQRPDVVQSILPAIWNADTVAAAVWRPGFQVVAEGQALPAPPTADPLPAGWDYPGLFRAAAVAHLSRVRLGVSSGLVTHVPMAATVGHVRTQMHPRVALARLARAVVSTGDGVIAPTAPGVAPLGAETVMMAPAFPQPMYEPLKEQSQDLLLPGLDRVQPDTVVGLQTNRAFVEAYMIGLNFEMGRELLWRGFPTDQQGTYFKQFWGTDAGTPLASDIDDLHTNLGRALGSAPPNAPANQFVLLLRSSLLRRYPNAIVYLTPALTGTTGTPPPDIFPIFNGGLEPDVNFFGFPLAPEAAVGQGGDPGYFVVIQEHPTEPRFGVDANSPLITTPGHPNYLAIGTQPPAGLPLKGHPWGKNGAHTAEILRRLPVRIAIHASQLVALP